MITLWTQQQLVMTTLPEQQLVMTTLPVSKKVIASFRNFIRKFCLETYIAKFRLKNFG